MAAGKMMNAEKMERDFEKMIDEAVDDLKSFLNEAACENMFRINITTNFKELFEICLDIKKKERERDEQNNDVDGNDDDGDDHEGPLFKQPRTK